MACSQRLTVQGFTAELVEWKFAACTLVDGDVYLVDWLCRLWSHYWASIVSSVVISGTVQHECRSVSAVPHSLMSQGTRKHNNQMLLTMVVNFLKLLSRCSLCTAVKTVLNEKLSLPENWETVKFMVNRYKLSICCPAFLDDISCWTLPVVRLIRDPNWSRPLIKKNVKLEAYG